MFGREESRLAKLVSPFAGPVATAVRRIAVSGEA
jgi:hypothetical protein